MSYDCQLSEIKTLFDARPITKQDSFEVGQSMDVLSNADYYFEEQAASKILVKIYSVDFLFFKNIRGNKNRYML